MHKILLVEDDPVLGRGLKISLDLEGYSTQWEQSLKSASEARKKSRFDLMLLDLGLPDGDGLSLLRAIRASDDTDQRLLPVVILTAKTDENSVVEGLNAGANDYVRKPFGNRELLARVKSTLRVVPARTAQISFDRLTISAEQRKASWDGNEIELNRREFDLLCCFVQNAEKVVTREALLQAIDKDAEIYDRTIDSHVSHLRARLRQTSATIQVESVYGVGYRLVKEDATS